MYHNNSFVGVPNFLSGSVYEIIRPIRLSKRKYEIDSLLQQYSIDVLRLPRYHCHYNPIEMVWGFCKTYYNKHFPSQRSRKSEVIKICGPQRYLYTHRKCGPEV
jgi:transposase